jgi:hypothetical protein
MKTSFALLIVSFLFVSLSVQAYDDPPKDQKCAEACTQKYTPAFNACKGVVQCESYVHQEARNCIHQCPDAQ